MSAPSPQITQANSSSEQSVANPEYYLVKPGDTLYSIAFRFSLDYKKLANANSINTSYQIFEGQSLKLAEVKNSANSALVPAPVSVTADQNLTSVSVTNNNSQNVDSQKTGTGPSQMPIGSWKWPHNGKIVRTFEHGVASKKGIDLEGRIGDSVQAATKGVVVYAGNGLPGYGNLIILEHANSMLSAYAFTQNILVSEKDHVKTGQKIATMGKQGDQPSLHFEIRQNGKPVDPVMILPRR